MIKQSKEREGNNISFDNLMNKEREQKAEEKINFPAGSSSLKFLCK